MKPADLPAHATDQVERRTFLMTMVAGALLAGPLAVGAQPARRVWRIGFLFVGTPGQRTSEEAFLRGLRELGYREGQNVVIEARYAEGRSERLDGLAAELVYLKVDVIVTAGMQGALAARSATTTIPIVVATAADLVGGGLATSLARPGGNVTGTSSLNSELSGKRIELLKELLPRLSRIAVLWNGANPGAVHTWQETQAAAQKLAVKLRPLEIRKADDLGPSFEVAKRGNEKALVVIQDSLTLANQTVIAQLAARHRLPAIYGSSGFVEAGGLIAYGASRRELWRHAAVLVDKIFKGAKPGDLPIEQPTKFELVINLKTAKALGLTIPPSVLARADEVIQ
jgi:putative ABC transport system substrate-binding protein